MAFFKAFFFEKVNEVNTYMIGCSRTREVFLIDAGADTKDYDAFLKEHDATLKGIFLTHSHWDHEQSLDTILQRFDVPVYSMIGNTRNGHGTADGESLPIGHLENYVLQTAGHTPDALTLVVMNRFAFVGDTLFAGSIGGTASGQQKQEEISHIRTKIFALPEHTLICPGHGPMTTVRIEKNCNPLLAG
jgi:glyoxylase-like metal-dependent hydrolase (beta-lactamase superfamily II)